MVDSGWKKFLCFFYFPSAILGPMYPSTVAGRAGYLFRLGSYFTVPTNGAAE